MHPMRTDTNRPKGRFCIYGYRTTHGWACRWGSWKSAHCGPIHIASISLLSIEAPAFTFPMGGSSLADRGRYGCTHLRPGAAQDNDSSANRPTVGQCWIAESEMERAIANSSPERLATETAIGQPQSIDPPNRPTVGRFGTNRSTVGRFGIRYSEPESSSKSRRTRRDSQALSTDPVDRLPVLAHGKPSTGATEDETGGESLDVTHN
jgi:hypothetical protein